MMELIRLLGGNFMRGRRGQWAVGRDGDVIAPCRSVRRLCRYLMISYLTV